MRRALPHTPAIVLVVLAATALAQESPWTARLLPGEATWRATMPNDINSAGVVVGMYHGTGELGTDRHPILWDSAGSGYVDMAATYGAPSGLGGGVATAINDSGIVAGYMYDTSVRYGSLTERAILWDTVAGTYKEIHPSGFTWSVASDLHDNGRIAGSVYRSEWPAPRGYRWEAGGDSGVILQPAAGFGMAQVYGLAADGSAAGFSMNSSNISHATVWTPDGTAVDLHALVQASMPDADAPSLVYSSANGIDGNGRVAGFIRDMDSTILHLWTWTTTEGVLLLDEGGGVNSVLNMLKGRFAVGFITHSPGLDEYQAAVWVDGLFHELPLLPGIASMWGSAVNERGVITGNAVYEGNTVWWQGSSAYVAEPTPDGDFDGDALLDKWELQSYVHDNGARVDLPAMGANPLRKDIFVQIDAMGPTPYDHMPSAQTLQPVVDAFAAHDVALHLHLDETLPFDSELGTLDGLGRYQWGEFDALKAAHFAPELESAVRYCVFAHRLATLSDSGLARGEPSSDFIVALGAFAEETGSIDPWWQAGTFMHELGHVLGLRHGGADVTNRKPNYLSVMNYAFQKQGLRVDGVDGHFDYSFVKLPDLDESSLLEGGGLGSDPQIAGFQTLFQVTHFDPVTFESEIVAKWSGDVVLPIDWNDDGGIDAGAVTADLNGDGSIGVLRGHDDWSALDFAGGTVGFGVGLPPPPPPQETGAVEELTVEEAKAIRPPPVQGLAARAGRGMVRLSWTPVGPYGQATYTVYRWSGDAQPEAILTTGASVVSDRVGPGIWHYHVTATDTLGVESEASEGLAVMVR